MMNKILKLYQKIENSLSYLFANSCNEIEFLKKRFNKKKIILLDLGCNLGTYTDFICKNLKTKKIYIFEPSKICFKFLKERYKKNKIYIHNKALSDKQKILKFYEKEIISQSTLYNRTNNIFNDMKNRSIYNIKCMSLDEFYKTNSLKEIYDLVKIDCEGEDYNILKGSKDLLKKSLIKLIKIEIEFKNDNFYKIINYLNMFDYKLLSLTKIKFNKDQDINHIDAYFGKK
jgi:FkbM family methyltransferase